MKKPRREIDNKTVERSNSIVTNLRESVILEKQGDLYELLELGRIKEEDILDSDPHASGVVEGRTGEGQITYHKNNNGTAASEIAIATLVYKKAKEAVRNVEVDLVSASELLHAF